MKRIGTWLDERLGLHALSYPVPRRANSIGYLLGGITMVSMAVLFVSGIYLAQYYHPHPSDAHNSVLYITKEAPFGAFVRGLHFWAANTMMVTLLLHLARVFISRSYRAPREMNWIFGLGLFAVTIGLFFTGTVLKWDQEGWEALQHNIAIGKLVGAAGSFFTPLFTPSTPLLSRLYSAHTIILPLALLMLLGLHFWLVKYHGISAPLDDDEKASAGTSDASLSTKGRGASSFRHHFVTLCGIGCVLVGVIGFVALVFSTSLGPVPKNGIEVTKPPWLFLPIYPLEDVFGIAALFWAPLVLFALLALVPFIDTSKAPHSRRRTFVRICGLLLFVAFVILGIIATLSGPSAHVMKGS